MEFSDKSHHVFRGKWIWGEEKSVENSYYYFRKLFEVTKNKDCVIHITADTRYQLYINGKYIGYGPIQSQPYCTYYDTWNITNYLHKGKNVIVIIVYYGGHLIQTKGGLLFEVVNSNNELLACSDKNVKTKKMDAYRSDSYSIQYINRYAPSQGIFDARKEPENLESISFDDSKWNIATVRKGFYSDTPPAVSPWSIIRKRPIPMMNLTPTKVKDICCVEECLYLMNRFRANDLSISLSQVGTPILHTTVEGTEKFLNEGKSIHVKSHMDGKYGGIYNPTFIVDFGKVITAFFELEVEGFGGESIEIGYAERLVDGHFNNALECQFADSYTLKSGKQTFRSFNWRGYRYVKLVFKDCQKGIDIHKIQGIISEYPYKERGKFKSNDLRLNEVFEICKETLKLCSNESIVDTPWREQSQWTGDATAVTIGGIYSCFGDTLLPEKYIEQSSSNQFQTGFISNITNVISNDYQNTMVDYNLWWVMGVYNHYLYTGDEIIIHKYYPMISKLMLSFFEYIDQYGMLNHIPYIILIDWANHDRRGENTFLNALFYGTLEIFYKMANIKNDDYMMKKAKNYRNKIKSNFMDRFYDYKKECFVDANIDGILSSTVSESANMLSIYFGLCKEEKAKKIIDNLLVEESIVQLVKAEPFMALYTLKALNKLKMQSLAINIIINRWYERMVKNGASSTYEEWSENGSYRNGKFLSIFRSHSHAWSAGPAQFLIKHLAGIEIIEPGCKKILVDPAKVSIDYEITYPTPKGNVIVKKTGDDIKIDSSKEIEIITK